MTSIWPRSRSVISGGSPENDAVENRSLRPPPADFASWPQNTQAWAPLRPATALVPAGGSRPNGNRRLRRADRTNRDLRGRGRSESLENRKPLLFLAGIVSR